MTERMPDEQLEQIRKRANAATPGPWDVYGHRHGIPGCRCLSCYDDPTGYFVDHKSALSCEEHVAVANDDIKFSGGGCDVGPLLSYEDATFAAHARMDVPALLAEVDLLRKALRSAESRQTWRNRLGIAVKG